MTETLADRIRQRLAATGQTRRSASLKAGLSDAFVTNILVGKSSNPRSDTLAKLAAALETTPGWLLTGREDATPLPGNEIALAEVAPPPADNRWKTVPVLGTAQGSLIPTNGGEPSFEGFQIDQQPIEYAAQPPGIKNQKGLYAIYIVGDSMDPMHPPGDIRFVQPHRPPAPGDTVIVQTRHWATDPGQAYIKILRRRTGNRLILEQINPQVTLEIPLEYIVAVHRVIPNNELFGV